MFKKVVSLALTVVIFVSALSIPAFADATTPTGSCPLCGSPVQYTNFENLVAGWSIVSCTNPNCAYYQKHMSIANDILYHRDQGVTGGSPSRSNTATVPKNYYTTNNNSSTTNYNTVNSGTTNHYSTINTTNKTLNYTTYNQTTNNYVRNTYNYTNYTYNYDYNYYTVNVDNSTHYVIDNVNYITVLYPTGETVKDENGNDVPEYDYTDVYYELPDGRNSYDLTASEVWGTYFVYNVTSCEQVPEDDGTTLGLWHLDGDFKDASANAGKYLLTSSATTFVDTETGDYNAAVSGTGGTFSISNFDPYVSVPWTLEFRVYSASSDSTTFLGYQQEHTRHYSSSTPSAFNANLYDSVDTVVDYGKNIPSNQWNTVALTFDGVSLKCYLNGELSGTTAIRSAPSITNTYVTVSTAAGYKDLSGVWKVGDAYYSGSVTQVFYYTGKYRDFNPNFRIGLSSRTEKFTYDEVRLSRGLLYTENYSPSFQPFDTNSVLVRPSNPSDKDIVIMSNIPVNDYRIGGVRPTYPTKGDVYIYLENDVVESVQQYQGDGWAAVDAEIYTDGTWKTLKKFNLASVKSEEVETKPTPTPTPDPGTPTPTPTPGGSGCTHQYTITKEKEPTCTESGYKIYKCDLCGDTYTDTLKALGHDWHIVESASSTPETPDASPSPASSAAPDASPPPAESGIETTDPTASPAPTYTLYRCSRCNMEYKDFDGSGPPQNKDEEDEGGILGWLKKLLGSIWSGLLSILESIVGGTIDLVTSLIDDLVAGVTHVIDGLFDALGKIADFGGVFKDFLGAFFGYLPDEIITLLAFSISLGIVLMIIKFFRG